MTDPGTRAVLSAELKARKDEADVAKSEAEARKSAADAIAAEAAADKAKADAIKAAAEARAGEAAARKAEADVAEHDAPSAQQQRDASARKAIAEADKDAATARRAQLSALIPDFGAVKDSSTLEVKDGPPLMGTVLTFGALQGVGKTIGSKLLATRGPTPLRWHVLATSDPDLASSDAVYQDVRTGLEQLVAAAASLLEESTPGKVESEFLLPATDVVAALAAAVPGVLSLLSAHRTVSTAAVTVSDLAAAAAVVGAIRADAAAADVAIVHDDFRLVPSGEVYDANTRLSTKRQELLGRKIELGNVKSRIDADLATASELEKTLAKAMADAGKNPPPGLGTQLDDVRRSIVSLTRKTTDAGVRIGLVDSLLTSIDAFTAAIRVVPDGAHRSAIATATLHEQLHQRQPVTNESPGSAPFSHVLLVKAQPGQSQQLIQNQPLWFKDKFSTVVDVSVTYMLISTADSSQVAAGTVTGTAKAYGTIGERPNLLLDEPI